MTREQRNIQQLVFECTPIDSIIEIRDGLNFIDVVGLAGGDTLTYRFYDNGQVVER